MESYGDPITYPWTEKTVSTLDKAKMTGTWANYKSASTGQRDVQHNNIDYMATERVSQQKQ